MVEAGTRLAELAAEYVRKKTAVEGKAPLPILGALVNNKVEPLQYRIYNPTTIQLLDITKRADDDAIHCGARLLPQGCAEH